MKYKIGNIKIPLSENKVELLPYICKQLRLNPEHIKNFQIISKSIDARKSHQGEIGVLFSVVLQYPNKISNHKMKWSISIVDDSEKQIVSNKAVSFKRPPIVVGFGPAGIFAALKLAQYGLRPIVLERGKDVDARQRDIKRFWKDRILNENSNVQFGEGGAGTFSDGKLTTRVKDPLCKEILEAFVRAGAPEEIRYLNKPHVGTDKLRQVIKAMRLHIEELGGQVLFESQVTDIFIENGRAVGVQVNENQEYESDHILFATGHSARDTYEMIIKKGISLEPKGFAIGLRIEHLQEEMNKIQYGKFYNHPDLKAADYQLAYRDEESGRGVYSFCMCPGGVVVASSSEKEMVVTNGMSYFSRDLENANSAIVVNIQPKDFDNEALKGIEFQRKYERLAYEIGGKNYNAPVQQVGDFLRGMPSTSIGSVRPTYEPGVTPTDLSNALPDYVVKSIGNALPYFDTKLKGFATYEALLTGVETRTSSPVRMIREKESRESVNLKGFYPIGEGAGYAGGIMSAALDGLKCALAIVEKSK